MVKEVLATNEAAGLPTGLFSAVKPNPVGKNVDDGVAAYKAGGHDGIIAFGGGSGLDCAKAIALMAGQKRPLFDFEDKGDNWRSEEHTSELQSLMRISYAVFCLQKKK